MSRARHDGLRIDEFIAPISHRFLIPVFFVTLGLEIDWHLLFGWTALLAVGSAGLLLGTRETLHRRWLKSGGDARAYLLLCPNLTIVALAAKTMLRLEINSDVVSWLVLTGLFVTIPTLMLLPAGRSVDDALGSAPNRSTAADPVAPLVPDAKHPTK